MDNRRRIRPTYGTLDDVPVPQPRTPVRRLVLRPGVHVLRRSADELQVGLDPRRALVLPDRPLVRAALTTLASPAATHPEEYDARTVDLLAEAGLLVDADVLLPLVPTGAPSTTSSRAAVAALAAHDGDAVPDLLVARERALVQVVACGPPEAAQVAGSLTALLVGAGVRDLGHAGSEVRKGDRGAPREPDRDATGVLVSVGEPAREEADSWMRAGTPHLFVRLTEGHAVVGPFVHPGHTACLRCVDAHHTDVDPAWPLLVAQQASAVAREREDTLPEPVDPLLAALAGAWAAREIVTHAEGRAPATLSTTIRLDPHLTALETQTWPRHPACGCSGL